MARGRPRGASCSTAATDETVRLAPKPSQGALVPVTSTENRNLVVLQRSPATNSPGMFREPLAHPIVGPRPVEAVGVPPLVLRQGGQHVLDKLLPRRPLPPFLLPRQESFASLHILTRRASEGSEALPSLARRVRMSFFGARVILAFSRGSMSSSKTNRPWPADEPASPAGPPAVKIVTFSQSSREGS